jgi:hypothetical protein
VVERNIVLAGNLLSNRSRSQMFRARGWEG